MLANLSSLAFFERLARPPCVFRFHGYRIVHQSEVGEIKRPVFDALVFAHASQDWLHKEHVPVGERDLFEIRDPAPAHEAQGLAEKKLDNVPMRTAPTILS